MTTSTDGLIRFEYDEAMLHVIEMALGNLKSESRKVLKNAVNATAKQAQADLAAKAKETYDVKKTRFTKAMGLRKATASRQEATITVTGEQLELHDFKSSPSTYKSGRTQADAVKAKVLLSSAMKPLVKGDLKAFLVKFQSGHVTIAQRKGESRVPIKKLLSNSIPKMVGNQDKVYGVVEPHIYSNLMDNIMKEISKVVG